MDAVSKTRLVGLHPVLVARLVQLDAALMAQGVNFRITVALRSMAVQAQLYAQGRTTPGAKLTNAQPGYSWHQYGFAIDGVPMVNGSPDWVVTGPNWTKIYAALADCKLFSGRNFTDIADNDHIQLADIPESPTAADISTLQTNGMAAVWLKYFPTPAA